MQTAWDYRKDTVDTSSCRVIFGEADFLPGIVIDKYEDVLVVESLALGIDRFKETIVRLLKECMACLLYTSIIGNSIPHYSFSSQYNSSLPIVSEVKGVPSAAL